VKLRCIKMVSYYVCDAHYETAPMCDVAGGTGYTSEEARIEFVTNVKKAIARKRKAADDLERALNEPSSVEYQ